MLPKGYIIAGRYRVEEMIGSGGQGYVFRATNFAPDAKIPDVQVAVKMTRVDSRHRAEQILSEAEKQQRVNAHVAVVHLWEALYFEGIVFLVTRLYERTLEQALQERGGKLTWEQFHPILLTMLDVMAFLHMHGILHRDIKPANIFVIPGRFAPGQPESAVLGDFGLAEFEDVSSTVAVGSRGAGTPHYLAPELDCDRPARPSRRTDIYAAGVTAYQALTGRLPYDGQTRFEIRDAKRGPRPSLPSAFANQPLPPCIDKIIMRAIHPWAWLRFRNGNAMRAAIFSDLDAETSAHAKPRTQEALYLGFLDSAGRTQWLSSATPDATFSVGSGAADHLRVSAQGTLPGHATLRRSGHKVFVAPSAGAVWVNSGLVRRRKRIANNDMVTMGSSYRFLMQPGNS